MKCNLRLTWTQHDGKMPEGIETNPVVVQAESKAADAASRLEELLQRTSTAWLPLWLEMHYNKVQTQHSSCGGRTPGCCGLNARCTRLIKPSCPQDSNS